MVETADVLVENFRPSVPAGLSIDYPRVKLINPRLVYCGLTGYGDSGLLSEKDGFDQVAMPQRNGGVSRRRARQAQSGLGGRCSTISPQRFSPMASPPRCFIASAQRCRAVSELVVIAQRIVDPGRTFRMGGQRGP
jgi:hypothetical protein